ncbi:hypothetical protein B0H13DRAFT_1880392 [Mycena leptocephala]|nr:hypothetical protein B0H13DRAFT_1880392 [Mycena leptocephala]
MAADYAEEQWDAVDHMAVDPDDVGELLERLCGPEVGEENYSEDEEPEMDEPETESDGEERKYNISPRERPRLYHSSPNSLALLLRQFKLCFLVQKSVRWTKRGSSMLGGSVRSRSLTSVYDGDPVVSPSYPPLSPHLFVLEAHF